MILLRYDWFNAAGAKEYKVEYQGYKSQGAVEYKTGFKPVDSKVIRYSRLWNSVPLLGYD